MITWWMLLWIWLACALIMVAVWAIATRADNLGYVDVAWAGLMGCMAIAAGCSGRGASLPRALIAGLGALWGLRLCVHLYRRVHGESEDGRYVALRKQWYGRKVLIFGFFQLQALVIALFAIPLLAAASNPVARLSVWMIAGVLIWLVSVAGEAIADQQLSVWRVDPANKGKTCRAGLWAWSRHPNYFFEFLHWFSYVLFAIGAPLAWIALVGPLVMFGFLYRVTGIPYTEAQALRTRGDNYRKYQREVSAFVPWPPKQSD